VEFGEEMASDGVFTNAEKLKEVGKCS